MSRLSALLLIAAVLLIGMALGWALARSGAANAWLERAGVDQGLIERATDAVLPTPAAPRLTDANDPAMAMARNRAAVAVRALPGVRAVAWSGPDALEVMVEQGAAVDGANASRMCTALGTAGDAAWVRVRVSALAPQEPNAANAAITIEKRCGTR